MFEVCKEGFVVVAIAVVFFLFQSFMLKTSYKQVIGFPGRGFNVVCIISL